MKLLQLLPSLSSPQQPSFPCSPHRTPSSTTNKPFSYGWGTLIVAGGGAYYFAKKSINADRAQKAETDRQKRIAQAQLEAAYSPSHPASPTYRSQPPPKATTQSNTVHAANLNPPAPQSVTSELGKRRAETQKGEKETEAEGEGTRRGVEGIGEGNPSHEASVDPAPTRHAPEDESQKMREKSKYEASDVFRSRKGDRF
ncbi:hypothetical protein K491DRAFT_696610, partial [Lophiostoma macrostomum CBS 122681]